MNDNKIRNIFYMLSYAVADKSLRENDKILTNKENFENIYNLFSILLIETLNPIIKKGINKYYSLENDEIQSIKGKINITETLKKNSLYKHKIVCEYDEFNENIYINQIIKTTIFYLLKCSKVTQQNKIRLKTIYNNFDLVGLIETKNISWNRIKFYRDTKTYKLPINICNLILNGLMVSLYDGTFEFSEFLSDKKLSYIFESFVREYYKYHYPNLNPSAKEIKWNTNQDFKLLPKMKTDITLTNNNHSLIIDTKYYNKILQYHYDSYSWHNSNLNQVFTYVKNEDKNNSGKVSGMLLYAKTDELYIKDESYNMGGNKISINIIDLTKDFETIKNKLNTIANNFILETNI